jgi:hypothetical protein
MSLYQQREYVTLTNVWTALVHLTALALPKPRLPFFQAKEVCKGRVFAVAIQHPQGVLSAFGQCQNAASLTHRHSSESSSPAMHIHTHI